MSDIKTTKTNALQAQQISTHFLYYFWAARQLYFTHLVPE